MAHILIIDDDHQMNNALASVVKDLGHSTTSAFTLGEGIEKARYGLFDVVFLDVRLPDGNGLDYLPQIRSSAGAPDVIIVTAYDHNNGAELAIKNGAWDYIKKPVSINDMTLPLVRVLQYREEKKSRKTVFLKREGIIGNSPKINDALTRAAQAASTNTNILITGATGTGKELFARTIHENSSRAQKNFVVVDCATLPESLVESILFGHEKGAFTGADKYQEGLVFQAHGGTLFLDEVGELPLPVQKAFLRVLQERSFTPLGAKQEKQSNFRLIAATNRNPEQMVREKKFRQDFLFRINSFHIELPALTERKEDIRELFCFFINKFCTIYNIETKGYSPEFLEAMITYDWPGNVRELSNTMDQVISVAQTDPTLFPYHLPDKIRVKIAESQTSSSVNRTQQDKSAHSLPVDSDTTRYPTFKEYRETMERHYFLKLLSNVNGKKNEACRKSGLSRSRFFSLLKKYDL